MANAAKQAIKAYLDNRAANDAQFALAYAKKNKSIDRCFDYIMGEASKRGRAVCMTDEEVFGLAVHYYDEDNIKIVNVRHGGVSHSAPVQLTEDEKQQARKEAMERFGDAYIREQREQGKKRRPAASTTTDAPMGSLFDMAAL